MLLMLFLIANIRGISNSPTICKPLVLDFNPFSTPFCSEAVTTHSILSKFRRNKFSFCFIIIYFLLFWKDKHDICMVIQC